MPQQRGRAHLPLPKTSNNGPFSNSASPSPCVPCRTAPHKGLYTTSHRDSVVSGTSLGGVVGQHHHWIGGAHVHSSHRPGSWESSLTSAPLRMEGHTRCRSKRLERGTGVRGRYKRRIGLCVRKDSAPPPLPPASSAPLCATRTPFAFVLRLPSVEHTSSVCTSARLQTSTTYLSPSPYYPYRAISSKDKHNGEQHARCSWVSRRTTSLAAPFPPLLMSFAPGQLRPLRDTHVHRGIRALGQPDHFVSTTTISSGPYRRTNNILTHRRSIPILILILAPNGQWRRGSSAATRRVPRWTRTRCSRRRSATGSRSSSRGRPYHPTKAKARRPPKTQTHRTGLLRPPPPHQPLSRTTLTIGRHNFKNSRRRRRRRSPAGLRRRSRSARCSSGPSSYAREARTSLCLMSPRFVRRGKRSIRIRMLSRIVFCGMRTAPSLDSNSFVLILIFGWLAVL